MKPAMSTLFTVVVCYASSALQILLNLLSTFFFPLHSWHNTLFTCCLFSLYPFPNRTKISLGQGSLFCFMMHPRHLEHCLVQSRYSINAHWMNKWIALCQTLSQVLSIYKLWRSRDGSCPLSTTVAFLWAWAALLQEMSAWPIAGFRVAFPLNSEQFSNSFMFFKLL